MVKLLAFAVAAGMLIAGCSAQYSYGQATYYNSIDHGWVPLINLRVWCGANAQSIENWPVSHAVQHNVS
jgi:hypothetical protein